MNIMLVDRKTNDVRFISKIKGITNNFDLALFTTNIIEINKLIKRYIKKYKIYLINEYGEVVQEY